MDRFSILKKSTHGDRKKSMNIYVGNLAYQTTEDELKAAFQAYGDVESARVIMDRETGRPKGFAFVEMPNREQAMAAIEALNGKDLGGRNIAVNEARPKPQREGGRGFGGGGGGGDRRGGNGGGRREFGGGGKRF